ERGAELISVDPDDRYVSTTPRDDMLRLFRAIDVFLPSRQDVDAMFPGMTPLDGMRSLRELAPELALIVIKCGADGAIAHRAGTSDYLRVPSAASSFVDATGAGDSFCGGALVGLSRGGDPVEALLRGSVSASFAVAAVGPAALVDASYET